MANVEAAYRSGEGSKLAVDKVFYDSLKEGQAKRDFGRNYQGFNAIWSSLESASGACISYPRFRWAAGW